MDEGRWSRGMHREGMDCMGIMEASSPLGVLNQRQGLLHACVMLTHLLKQGDFLGGALEIGYISETDPPLERWCPEVDCITATIDGDRF